MTARPLPYYQALRDHLLLLCIPGGKWTIHLMNTVLLQVKSIINAMAQGVNISSGEQDYCIYMEIRSDRQMVTLCLLVKCRIFYTNLNATKRRC